MTLSVDVVIIKCPPSGLLISSGLITLWLTARTALFGWISSGPHIPREHNTCGLRSGAWVSHEQSGASLTVEPAAMPE